jgi:DNA-directed RNA polymerase subunit RPC12/RpoP
MTGRAANTTSEAFCPQCGAPVLLPEYADVLVCTYCGSTLAREQALEPGSLGEQPEEQSLRSVQCSQCAGPLNARQGRRILVCGHCGVRVMVKETGGFSRWYFPAQVDRLRAAEAGAAWIQDFPGIARPARMARFADARLVYAPIWEHRALTAGWEFGYKLRTQNGLVHIPGGDEGERLELHVVKEGVKEPRLQERRFYQAATDFEALGATRPLVTGRELLVPLLAGELEPGATVLEAEGTAAEVAEKGRRAALQPLSGALVSDSHVFAFRETSTLLYYPLWLVRYQTGSRSCRIVVNGREGTVNAGTAPAAQGDQIIALAGQLGALVLAAALLIYFAVTSESGRAAFVTAAVIVSVVAVFLGRRFRAEKEVEYHEPFSG